MIYLFSFMQNKLAASNEPHDLAWSQWTPWPTQWLLVILFAFAFVDYLWLLDDYSVDTIALSEFYLHLWLWMNLLVILKFICIYVLSIYLYELPVMLIVN